MSETKARERVRLVIWDLDETFWKGTLTEGGVSRNEKAIETVVALARRGIVSAICSKNDLEPVQRILTEWKLWDYFIFPSVSWDSKGPRIKALVEAVQLRPETILFVDDNPMNLKEALHFVPGLQVSDESIIDRMLEDPLFTGKEDRKLARLAQYKLLETRHHDQVAAGDGVYDFLRSSGITVEIEHDIESNIDRAIELVNRTNQLNFIKARLPENLDEARSALREHLSNFFVQAGLVRVRDKYGDYGFVGFFVQHRGAAFQDLAYYCFSCRTLGMYIELWLYRRLGRPRITISGEVLTDLHDETIPCDWISLYDPHTADSGARAGDIGTMFIAGGCDLEAVAHYVTIHAGTLSLRLNTSRAGIEIRRDHSQMLCTALDGISEQRRKPMLALGYSEEDLQRPGDALLGSRVWLLSFWADAYYQLYRHRHTGDLVPFSPASLGHTNLFEMRDEQIAHRHPSPEAWAAIHHLREEYEPVGRIDEARFKSNIQAVLAKAPEGTQVLVLLMGEQPFRGMEDLVELHRQHNRWLLEAVAGFANVVPLRMDEFVSKPEDLTGATHYERLVYQRLAARVIDYARTLAPVPVEPTAPAPAPQPELQSGLQPAQGPAATVASTSGDPAPELGAKWYFAITQTTLDADADQGFRDCIRTAVASARLNTNLRPHMIYDGPEDEFTREMRAGGVEVIRHRISFHDALRRAQELQKPEWPDYMKTAEGAFLRLEIGTLEREESHILYTDCDVLFEQPVSIGHLRPEFFAIAPQFDPGSFYEDINCGVMVMNVDRLRRDRDALIEFMCENFARVGGYDQELLKLYYRGRWDPLSPVYNWKPHWGAQPRARIVHFHGPKPRAAAKLLQDPEYRKDDPVFQAWRHWFFVAPAGYDHYVRRWMAALSQYTDAP